MSPTKNPIYNGLLIRWAKSTGAAQEPLCEFCDKDMTGRHVFEGAYGWYCGAECKREAESNMPDDQEDAWERRQLGGNQ